MPRPTFAHPIFDKLYERDYFINDAVLREILALGPATAAPELLKIIDHALNQFNENDIPDYPGNFYFYHALYLLHELHAPEALDVYHRMLRFDEDSLEYWFSDDLFEDVPNLLARAGQTRLPDLIAIVEDDKLELQHRLVASEALSRLARQQPHLRPAISAFYQRYLRRIIAHADQAAELFPPDAGAYGYSLETYLGFLLADVQAADLRELEPEIRQLHRLGLVDKSIAGGEADVDFDRPHYVHQAPADLFARYQQLRDRPDNYSPFHPDAAGIARRRAEEEERLRLRRQQQLRTPQPRIAPPKAGRNDPCPCGSGLKYKKCCLK